MILTWRAVSTIDTALTWHSLGIACIPILANSKKPAICSWKKFQTVLPRESQLRAWFSQPEYSIAVITGWRGLVVVDWDDVKKHAQWQAACFFREFRVVHYISTPRGGYHYYFFVDKPTKCLALGGVDIKAQGGYVLTTPSPGYTKGRYARIDHIASIEDLHLPGYAAAMQPKPRPPYDPYEDALRLWVEGSGASIEAIKEKWSAADVLGITDGRVGRTWRTNCPLHGGTHLSLAVYPDGGWHCFVCGCGGDVIDLYAALHKVSNGEALRRMGQCV